MKRYGLRKRKPIGPLEQAKERAFAPGSFISYRTAWSFVNDLREVENEATTTRWPRRGKR